MTPTKYHKNLTNGTKLQIEKKQNTKEKNKQIFIKDITGKITGIQKHERLSFW